MKKFLSLVLALVMVLSLVACGQKAEEPKPVEQPVAVEPATEKVAYDIDGYIKYIRSLAGDRYTKVEPAKELKERGVVEVYLDSMYEVSYQYRVQPKNGRTLEQYVKEIADAFGACYSVKKDDLGKEYSLVTYFTSALNGAKVFNKRLSVVNGDNIESVVALYYTKEVQIGDTDTYLFIPQVLDAFVDEEEVKREDSYVGSYKKPENRNLCDMYLYTWKANGETVDDIEKEYVKEFSSATITDNYKKEIDGQTYLIMGVDFDYEKTPYTGVFIDWVDNGTGYEVYMESEKKAWPEIGEAMMQAIHKGSVQEELNEYLLDPFANVDKKDYVKTENKYYNEYYVDKNGIMNIGVTTEKLEGKGMLEYVLGKEEVNSGCGDIGFTSDGAVYGRYAFLNSENCFTKVITSKNGDKDEVIKKVYKYPTKEVQVGDSNQYFYIPNAYTQYVDEEEIRDFDGEYIASYVSETYGMPYISTYSCKATLEENKQYYKKGLGDSIVEEIYSTNPNGIKYFLFKVDTSRDGEHLMEVFINWEVDGTVYEIYMESPRFEWNNYGLAMVNGIHKK